MAISKKVRFEVFKRDEFTCRYCGQKPPGVVLEVDHVNPRASGGGDEEVNLVTSCFDCNRGKSDRKIGSALRPRRDSRIIQKPKEEVVSDREVAGLLNKLRAVYDNSHLNRSFEESLSAFLPVADKLIKRSKWQEYGR